MEFLIIAILGACLGSLWSVLFFRLQDNIDWTVIKSILIGHSYCPNCKHRLKRYNLIPVISYIRQKWKCSFCNKQINKTYITLEILTAIITVATYYLWFFVAHIEIYQVVLWILINWLFVLLIVYDFQKHELHVPIRFISVPLVLWLTISSWYLQLALSGTLLWGGIYLFIYRIAKIYAKHRYGMDEGFGQWDVWMAFLLGAMSPLIFLYNGLPLELLNALQILIIFVVLSSVVWLLIALFQKILKITKDTGVIAFIPAMIISFWIMLIYGDTLINLIFSI